MADDKKKDGPVLAEHDSWLIIEWGVVAIIVLSLLYRFAIAVWTTIQNFVINNFGSDSIVRRLFADPSTRNLNRIGQSSLFLSVIDFIITYSKLWFFLAALIVLGVCIHFFKKLKALGDIEEAILRTPPAGHVEEGDPLKKRWMRIMEHVSSDNPANWRLAILESDIILDELLDINGYRADSIGEKLKLVKTGDMATLQDAWEAHKIRNAIAHEGEAFTLTEREARRVISLYERVFKEFKLI